MRDAVRRCGSRLAGAAILLLAVGSCGDDDAAPSGASSTSTAAGQASFGSDVPVDLAIYFNDGTTDGEITTFIQEVLSKPPIPERQGRAHLDGVQYTSGDYTRDAAYVTFFGDATEEQRQAVLDAVEASPLVDHVATDVVPSETPIE